MKMGDVLESLPVLTSGHLHETLNFLLWVHAVTFPTILIYSSLDFSSN